MGKLDALVISGLVLFVLSLIGLVVFDGYLDQRFYHDCVQTLKERPASEVHMICKKHR